MKLTTARETGLLYLGLTITGMLAFLYARNQIFVDGDAVKTSANLVEKENLARFGIALEVALVGFQALTALWFYKLFSKKDSFKAGLIAVFGMVNAITILVASAMWLGALQVSLDGGEPSLSQLLFNIHENLWVVGKLFFGLWLIPMAILSKQVKMPRPIFWLLIAGGAGYILSTFTSILLPEQTTLTESLPMFATIGELWLVGYLLFKPVKA